jgi:hypothetical protein
VVGAGYAEQSSTGRNASLFNGFPRLISRTGYYVGTRSCGADGPYNIYTAGWAYINDGTYGDYSTFVVKYPPGAYSTGRPAAVTKQGIEYTQGGAVFCPPDQVSPGLTVR